MHVTFISITYDFQWYENVTVELLILRWSFSCEVCIITFKKRVWPQGHNKAKWYSVTQCYKVIIPRSWPRNNDLHTRSSSFYFHRRMENVWPSVRYANIYTSIKVAEHSFLVPMRYSSLFLNHWQLGSQNWQAASSTKKDYILICFNGVITVAMVTQLVINQH